LILLFEQALIGWNDEKHSYDRHNLIFDVPFLGLHRSKRVSSIGPVSEAGLKESLAGSEWESLPATESEQDPVFSIVRHYPPQWQRNLSLERDMVGPSFDDQSSVPLC